MKMSGRRPRDRPSTRWIDHVKINLERGLKEGGGNAGMGRQRQLGTDVVKLTHKC
jgi:hypothetical protein